jgi:acid stress-induced BolA-like protein IbaG/YrbA
MQIEEIKALIEQGFSECEVRMQGDGTHFEALIVSPEFSGMTMLQQHQLVYKSLGDKMGTDIHALSMQTLTPEEWDKKKGLNVL